VWRARKARTSGDRAYLAYVVVMVIGVAVAPIGRLVWLSATSAEGIAALTSSSAPAATAFAVSAAWAGALLVGRDRGPALLPSFVTYALATSDLPATDAFRAPVLRAGALVTAVCALLAGVLSGSLLSRGLIDPQSAAIFVAVGALVGILTTVAWLAGQSCPRAAIPAALGLLVLGPVTGAVPALHPLTPWGWVALAYPGMGSPHALVALVALSTAGVAAVPWLMNRLEPARLASHAARWDSASMDAASMDFGAVAAVYRARPHRGRRARAVRPRGPLAAVFLIRDAIGAVRTPGRLLAGVLAIASAGALLALASAPAVPSGLLGAGAGLLLFAGLGPVTDGMRHAADVAGDLPLYGIGDGQLLVNQLLFPLAGTFLVLGLAVFVCLAATGASPGAAVLGALVLPPVTLGARLSSAMKGPMPPALLAPIPTPMGDFGAAVRLVWAVDGVALAALAGFSAVLVLEAPLLILGVAAALLAICMTRWRHRT
jgi:hypothetical protein